ncbi:unnamed protein product [Bursaphelenchus xylophilus]|uniref:SOSS complex subunit A homolog n=1 Tax=Bursaphelenchus xylophilus TaxID=6326 RepID=A0A1I7RVA0_BURXY|nr:unnamed protein product [Bursaphelenchus xylophilus]CAG9086588.1 unnamed protein product [Bursaphelenchus xylophilus]
MSRPPLRGHGYHGQRPHADRTQERYPPQTVCRMLQLENSKLERLEDANKLLQFEEAFVQLQAMLVKIPDINMGEYLLKNMNNADSIGKASIQGFLCDPPKAQKYLGFIALAAKVDNWQETLTSFNKIILDGFCILKPQVRLRLVDLMEYIVLENPPNCDNVLLNFFRETNNGSRLGDINHALELAELQAEFVIRQKEWFSRNTFNFPLTPVVCITFTRVLAELPPGRERLQSLLCSAVDILFHDRFRDLTFLGREQILIMLRVSKINHLRHYWRILLHNPRLLLPQGMENITKLMAVKCSPNISQYRVAFKIQNVIEYVLTYKPEIIERYHCEWFIKEYLSGFDAATLRADIIRFVVTHRPYNNTEALKASRPVFLVKLLNHCKSPLEFQMAKNALIFDWLCTDANDVASVSSAAQLDVFLSVLKYCFNNNINNNVILANSTIDQLIRSVFEFQPAFSHLILNNLANSVRTVLTYQPGSLKIFDHPRIDRSNRTALSVILPDYFGKPPESQAQKPPEETRKRKSPDSEEVIPAKTKKIEPLPPAKTLKAIEEENRRRTQSKLKELSGQLNGEIKKRFDLMMNITQKNGVESMESFEAAKSFFARLKVLKVDEAQINVLADCILEYWEPFLSKRRYFKRLRANANNIIYAFFENWQATKGQKTARQNFSALVKKFAVKSPLIGILTIIHGLDTNSGTELYKEFIQLIKSNVPDQLSKDIAVAAVEDSDSLRLILTKIASFPEALGTVELIEVMCNYINESDLYILTKILSSSVSSPKLFDRGTFHKLVKKSHQWSPNAQWLFWNIIRIEGIPADWLTDCLYLINDKLHPVASMNVLSSLNSSDLLIDVNLARDLFFRPLNDGLTLTFLKAIMLDDKSTATLAEQTTKVMVKLITTDRVTKPDKTFQHEGEAKFGFLENVLRHLEKARKAGTKDPVFMTFVKCEWFVAFYNQVHARPALVEIKDNHQTLFALWKKGKQAMKAGQKKKDQKELRRKRTVDYVELSDDD